MGFSGQAYWIGVAISIQGSYCCFLTHIQVSQETGNMVWYSHLFKSFPQFVMMHTVKGFSVVNKTEVDVFLEFPCFLYDPANVGSLISGSSAFLKPSLYIWKFSVHVLLKPSLKDSFFFLVYNIVLVLPYINMNPPWVYLSSQS